MNTFLKRPAILLPGEPVLNLVEISGYIYKKNQKRQLSKMNAMMLISSLLKSKASMRWYKTFRIETCEKDDDII